MDLLIPGHVQETKPINWFHLIVLFLAICILFAVASSVAATRAEPGNYSVIPGATCAEPGLIGLADDGALYRCDGPGQDRWRK
jgi:hypothetical protein